MLSETAKKYYSEQNRNCAEAMLLAANEEYGLGIDAEAVKLVGGFGGGMGCGRACGALCGGIAAIGKACIGEKAHSSPQARAYCAQFARAFVDTLGSDQCEELKATYMQDDVRCARAVELGAQVLEEVFGQIRVAGSV